MQWLQAQSRRGIILVPWNRGGLTHDRDKFCLDSQMYGLRRSMQRETKVLEVRVTRSNNRTF